MKMLANFIGVLSIISGAMVYAMYGIFTRHLSHGFQPFSQQYSRSLIALIIVGLYIFVSKGNKQVWKKIEKNDLKWFALLVLTSLFDVVLLFVAFDHISIATVYFLLYASIIITGMILGKFLFADKLNNIKVLSLIFAFLGLLLIFSLEIDKSNYMYLLFPVLAGVSVGSWNVFSKKVSAQYSAAQIIFVNLIFVIIIGFAFSFLFGESLPIDIEMSDLAWLIGFSIAGLSAMSLIIIGFKYLEAQKASLLMPTEIVFAAVFGYLFYGELISFSTFIGGLLIFIGAMIPNLNFGFVVRSSGVK